MRKKLIYTLILAMLLSVFTACGESGGKTGSSEGTASKTTSSASDTGGLTGDDLAFRKFDEPVDVHIGMSVSPIDTSLPPEDSAENNQYTRYLKEKYNINVVVDWTAAEGNDYNQKVSLAIASDSLPDGLIAKEQTFLRKASQSNLLKDITDTFDKYASSQVKGIMETTEGRAMESVSFDGKMQALPNISATTDGVHILHVRKDWLDEYGLETPKTLDDVEKIGKVFLEKKPAGDQTIALSGPDKNTKAYATFLESSSNAFGFDPLFSAYDVYPGYWLDNGDKTVSYGSLDDGMKPALEHLARWYKEGIIDPEMGTRDKSMEPVNANQVGMWFGPWWGLGYGNGDSFKNDETANWQSYPIFNDEGKWNVHMKSVGTESCMISKNASDDATAAMVIMYNALVRDEATFDTSVAIGWYPLRVVAAPADECEYENIELTKILSGEADPEDYNDPMLMYKLMYSDAKKAKEVVPGFEKGRELTIADFNQENRGDFQRFYALLIGDRPYTTTSIDKEVYSVTYNMTDKMEKRWSNFKTMEEEVMLKIITGQSDISAFDEYVKNWKDQGGEDFITEVEALLQ